MARSAAGMPVKYSFTRWIEPTCVSALPSAQSLDTWSTGCHQMYSRVPGRERNHHSNISPVQLCRSVRQATCSTPLGSRSKPVSSCRGGVQQQAGLREFHGASVLSRDGEGRWRPIASAKAAADSNEIRPAPANTTPGPPGRNSMKEDRNWPQKMAMDRYAR